MNAGTQARVAFRADASLQIGTGHVMRCLTLADALREQGRECHFVCREHEGHLIDLVRRRGHVAHSLGPVLPMAEDSHLAHAAWLGAGWMQDAQQTMTAFAHVQPQWLVVDHYALDARWEERLRRLCRHIMVIDDLADRRHDCDLLLDQTLGRQPEDYRLWVPEASTCLTGAGFALLRPEFSRLRPASLQRRQDDGSSLRQLLVTMGGVDAANATGAVLSALEHSGLPPECRVTVVLGPTAPWLRAVQEQAAAMSRPVQVLSDVPDMGRLMAESDLAIGAAGSTSWERCCLGLPSLMVVLADNQQGIARALEATGAAVVLGDVSQAPQRLDGVLRELAAPGRLRAMSDAASRVTDGQGVQAVLQHMGACDGKQ